MFSAHGPWETIQRLSVPRGSPCQIEQKVDHHPHLSALISAQALNTPHRSFVCHETDSDMEPRGNMDNVVSRLVSRCYRAKHNLETRGRFNLGISFVFGNIYRCNVVTKPSLIATVFSSFPSHNPAPSTHFGRSPARKSRSEPRMDGPSVNLEITLKIPLASLKSISGLNSDGHNNQPDIQVIRLVCSLAFVPYRSSPLGIQTASYSILHTAISRFRQVQTIFSL